MHFKTGQPILKLVSPFLLFTFYLARFKTDQTAHCKMGSLFQHGLAYFEMSWPA